MNKNNSPLTRPVVLDLIGILLLFVFMFMSPPLGSDPGVGWHLKTGEWLSINKTFLYHDPFLWTTEGKEWISNQWLADLIFWQIFQLGDWDALALFCFAMPLLALLFLQGHIFWKLWQLQPVFFLSTSGLSILTYKTLPFIILSLSLLVAWVQWIIRPVIFSFSLFALVFYIVWSFLQDEGSSRHRFLFKLSLIFCLWANLHSAFPLGLGIIAAVIIGSIIEGRYDLAKFFSLSFVIAALSTLINPYGWNLHKNIYELLGNSYFMNLNAEWQSPDFTEIIFMPLLAALTLIAILFLLNSKQVPAWIKLIFLGLTILSLRSVRYISFLGMILPVVFVYLIYVKNNNLLPPHSSRAKGYKPALFFSVFTLLTAATFIPNLINPKRFSSELLNQVELWGALEEVCRDYSGKIISHPNYGGAITYKLYPACKASLDDRNELNGVESYQSFFAGLKNSNLPEIYKSEVLFLLPCKDLPKRNSSDYYFKSFGEFCLGRWGAAASSF
jgi:hypothetical protein